MPEDRLPLVAFSDPTPTTVNDGALARRMNAALAAQLGSGAVIPFEQMGMGGEDFSYFVQPEHRVPGYFFTVGGTAKAALDAAAMGGPAVAPHHSPMFKIDPESAVVTGASAMTAAVLELLKPA
jgi:metal-dependent amidase/aminoacylase/carboxypeptidase family protein